MIKCLICGCLVIFMSFVYSNEGIFSAILITKDKTSYSCSEYEPREVELVDGDAFQVNIKHRHYINFVLIHIPNKKEKKEVQGSGDILTFNYEISSQEAGQWTFQMLTDCNTSQIEGKRYIPYKGSLYRYDQCNFSIQVKKRAPTEINWFQYVMIGLGVLTFIIVIQTIVICYILKKKKLRRIEKLINSSSRNVNDTARYSATPRRPSKPVDDDCGSIYESLDIMQASVNTPVPPPIETLPRKPKTKNVPLESEDQLKTRPPLPIPSEVDVPDSAPVPNRMKMPAFCPPSTIPPTPDRPAPKMPRKLPVKEDPLANELNNILKKRQTGVPSKPSIPEKPEVPPETKPKPGPWSLKPPTAAKPATPIPPAKQPLQPTHPRNPNLPPQPTLAPKPLTKKWPPVNTQGNHPSHNTQPNQTHPTQSYSHASEQSTHPKPHSMPPREHSSPPMQHPTPPTEHPMPPAQRTTLPSQQNTSHHHQRSLPPVPTSFQPMDKPEEQPEYAEHSDYYEQEEYQAYEEYTDDDEEWTYEALPQYNIYSE